MTRKQRASLRASIRTAGSPYQMRPEPIPPAPGPIADKPRLLHDSNHDCTLPYASSGQD